MGTRSKTSIYDENSNHLVSLYRQMDGNFEGHGQELADFLKDFKVVNGISGDEDNKTANGMGCLAAQIVAHFKDGVGGFYICGEYDTEEYNYYVGLNDGVILLDGYSEKETAIKHFLPAPKRKVLFAYPRRNSEVVDWREVEVTEDMPQYICGIHDGHYKKFLKSKIRNQKIVELNND